ncbi:MAG: hypothetical protein NC936_02140 [Candidatus Omnitrophica bacterium]|nr:hypothetical protein [Candidatus Omnitrophota bacterium]MCM8770651.1 hypothetical protein [Candidatus Omnitrophota bacterium]
MIKQAKATLSQVPLSKTKIQENNRSNRAIYTKIVINLFFLIKQRNSVRGRTISKNPEKELYLPKGPDKAINFPTKGQSFLGNPKNKSYPVKYCHNASKPASKATPIKTAKTR